MWVERAVLSAFVMSNKERSVLGQPAPPVLLKFKQSIFDYMWVERAA